MRDELELAGLAARRQVALELLEVVPLEQTERVIRREFGEAVLVHVYSP